MSRFREKLVRKVRTDLVMRWITWSVDLSKEERVAVLARFIDEVQEAERVKG